VYANELGRVENSRLINRVLGDEDVRGVGFDIYQVVFLLEKIAKVLARGRLTVFLDEREVVCSRDGRSK